ncbi:MAG: hypothetical protein HW383_148, partial [Candidatus Magasanikbacteria bacterium]|nr:hypothetical protein [Candidatus Magasanikbacteria bacterium]
MQPGPIGDIKMLPARCLMGLTAPRLASKVSVTIHVDAETPTRCKIILLLKRFVGLQEEPLAK